MLTLVLGFEDSWQLCTTKYHVYTGKTSLLQTIQRCFAHMLRLLQNQGLGTSDLTAIYPFLT